MSAHACWVCAPFLHWYALLSKFHCVHLFGWGREYFIITHSCYCDQSAESLMWCGGGQRLLPPRATFKNLAVCGIIQWLYFNILWWVRLLHHRCVFFVFMLKILRPQLVAEASQGLSNIKQMAVTVLPCNLIVKNRRIAFFFVLIQCNKTQYFNSLVYPPSRGLVATRRISINTQGKGGMKHPSLSLSPSLSSFSSLWTLMWVDVEQCSVTSQAAGRIFLVQVF